MKICCFLFDDDDHDHSHIMRRTVTNDIVYYHALPITKEKTANHRYQFMMTIFISKCLEFVITFALYLTFSRTKVRFKIVFVLFTHSTIFSSHKKKQRDQLSIWVQEQRENLGSNHLDEEFLQTKQCLNEVTNVKIVIL